MSKLDRRSIYIEKDGFYYKFINCKIEPNDGSFYVTLLRDGESSESVTFDSETNSPVVVEHNAPRKKLVRVSYHSSGCVLYRHTAIESNYFEPISRLNQPNVFATWSIPSLDKLDQVDSVENDDYIINVGGADGRVEFTFMVAPWQQEIETEHFAVRYEGILSLIVIPAIPDNSVPAGLDDHFITMAPKEGLYKQQAIATDLSLIEYHQKIQETRDLIIYSPNKAGIYTIITTVPMRIGPKVKVSFVDENNHMELVSSKNNVVKFKVKNRHGHVVKNEVLINGIELCSEL